LGYGRFSPFTGCSRSFRLVPTLLAARSYLGSLCLALENEERRTGAADAIRALVEAIVLEPDRNQLKITLKGDLAGMLSAARDSKRSPDTGDFMVQLSWLRGRATNIICSCGDQRPEAAARNEQCLRNRDDKPAYALVIRAGRTRIASTLLPRYLDIHDRIRTRVDRGGEDIAVCRCGEQGDSLPWQTGEAIVPAASSSRLGHEEGVQSSGRGRRPPDQDVSDRLPAVCGDFDHRARYYSRIW
jgi:hypothetical protein